ncbi:MAG TPA: AmmeMemoRadiSam system protein B, partial [Steroidobacteraceae bacterium]
MKQILQYPILGSERLFQYEVRRPMKAILSRPNVRPAAVAGLFYPEESKDLRAAVEAHLSGSRASSRMPKALVVPHAGYIYSGPVAGKAYASVKPRAESLSRVILLGPSHRTWFRGLAIPSVEAFETPLGTVPLDRAALAQLRELPGMVMSDEPHALEHSLEVQLPFIQLLAPSARIVPIVAGQAAPAEVDAVLDVL